MKRIVKHVVGIDVAKDELVVCFGIMDDTWRPTLLAHKSFDNSIKGFKALLLWLGKYMDSSVPLRFVMEATASEAITLFGLERSLDNWVRPGDLYRKMRNLTRERDQLIGDRTVAKNQLHAEKAQAYPHQSSINRLNERISLLNKQEKELLIEINMLITSDKEVGSTVRLLCTIPGIGSLTAATLLAETNGFDLITSKRQLVSYAGLDVKEKQSGTSVKGKPKISKRGNRYLRKALHFPALTAIRHNEYYKSVFKRIVSKQGIKMKAAVAIQRKLLEMAFTIYKKKEKYDQSYWKPLTDLQPNQEKIGDELQ